jgi:hypothetical protein
VKLRKVMMGLRDLNENRLSKFEAALLLVKVLEDFLPDDVQYNWVHIFANQVPQPAAPPLPALCPSAAALTRAEGAGAGAA